MNIQPSSEKCDTQRYTTDTVDYGCCIMDSYNKAT